MPGTELYEPVVGWPHVPHGMTFQGDASSVAVGPDDHVYVFNRGPAPVLVFDRSGRYRASWGEGEFDWPHAAAFGPDGLLYLVDAGSHVVQRRTPEGRLLLEIGNPGQPAEPHSGECFNRPTDVAVDPETGNIAVTDGYGNARVHVFGPDGAHLRSWGTSGADPGQFSVPHGVVVGPDGRVLVCDRENFRIQVFDQDGTFCDQWHVHRPSAIRSRDGLFYVAEMGPPPFQHGRPHLGCRVSVLDSTGALVRRFGAPIPGLGPTQFTAPHGLAVDSRGDVYVAEVTATYLTRALGQTLPPGAEVPSLRKWALRSR